MHEPQIGAGTISTPDAGQAIDNPLGGRLTFRVRGADSEGAVTAFESVAPPGEGPPLHFHLDEDEVVYLLEGTLRVRLGDKVEHAPTGSCVFIPRKVHHTWQNVGQIPVRLLVLFTPAAVKLEAFFEQYAALPIQRSGLDLDAFRSLSANAGMDVVGPPLAVSHRL